MATVSDAFCKWFPDELTSDLFVHILNKTLNHRMVDPCTIFIDGTHIKASANKKKFQKEQVAKTAEVYSDQLRREVHAEREKLGFVECSRNIGTREVDGQKYDGLTFRLEKHQ